MVSWIKNTASVTASICIALAAPIAQSTLAQDSPKNTTTPKSSVNSFAPEVQPFHLDQDSELQKAVAERAKRIAAKKLVKSANNPVASVMIDESLNAETQPTVGSIESFRPASNPFAARAEPKVEIESALEARSKTEPDSRAKGASTLLTEGSQSKPADDGLSGTVALPPIIPGDVLRSMTIEAPTVIIRPPVDGSSQLKDCTMEVKKIGDTAKHEYAISLQVPDSVKVIEVLPSATGDSERNFRLRLDKGPQAEQPVTSKQKTPAFNVSSGQRPSGRQLNFSMPNSVPSVPQLRALPATQPESSRRAGFQKNPFFNRGSTRRVQDETAIQSDPPDHKELSQTTAQGQPQDSRSVQVAYNPADKNNEPVAVASQFVGDEKEAKDPVLNGPESVLDRVSLTTELSGPQEMELGDTGDFAVTVTNPTEETASEVHVKLDVPDEMDVVVLDRQAWIDQDDRTVTWRLATIPSGDNVTIRYRVQSTKQGDIQQKISVTNEGLISDQKSIDTMVMIGRTASANSQDYEIR